MGERFYNFDNEYIYELDLDNCILHLQSFPMFDLRRMPPTTDALRNLYTYTAIGVYERMPREHTWDWDLERFVPSVDGAVLDAYAALGAEVVTDIVPPPPENDTTEVRRRFAEVFVSMLCSSVPFGRALFEASTVGNDNEVEPNTTMYEMLDFMNHVTLRSPTAAIIDHTSKHRGTPLEQIWKDMRKPAVSVAHSKWVDRVSWVRPNVCVHFHPHLTDEPNLRMGVVNAVRAIAALAPTCEQITYGVVTSLSHCALVSYNTKTRIVRHTPALPLLPSPGFRRETSRQLAVHSAGITALTGLCQHLDDAGDGLPSLASPKALDNGRLPFDVLVEVASCIDDSDTLLCFAAASHVCKQAAKSRLMLPKLNNALVTTCDKHSKYPRDVLCADGRSTNLSHVWLAHRSEMLFDDVLDLFTDSHQSYPYPFASVLIT